MTPEERIQSLEKRVDTLEKFILSMYPNNYTDQSGRLNWRTYELEKEFKSLEEDRKKKDKWRF
mgnify:CR=1 FL=1